jgi:molybdopterin-guanine dinucleotide biosynthesis protein A
MIGILLAGGKGSRLGGRSKATIEVAGRPLAAYPAAVLTAICERVAIVAKPATELPPLDGVERWDEPDEPRHPIVGIVHALEHAGGEPVLVCAADMPYVTAEACQALLTGAAGDNAAAVVGVAGGVVQPLFAIYAPAALEPLSAAAENARLTDVVESLEPARVAVPPPIVRSVNTPEDLAEAEAGLGS